MSSVWKVLIGLALVVPMVAYVAGSLVASAADDPAPRQTIQIREPDPRPSSTPTRTPDPSPSETADDVEVITPGYDDFDDRDDRGDDDGGDDDGGDDDDSGPGGED